MANPAPLELGKIYHIYNRGNNRENIFIQERNYAYFLKLWELHIQRVADTYGYCLLKNHFHAVVHLTHRLPRSRKRPARQPSQYFSNFFNAYARAVNIATSRSGALFERPFHRIEVTSEEYLASLIVYIHQNPERHGFVDDFQDWPYSSFHELLGGDSKLLNCDAVMKLFGGKESFLQIHCRIQPLEILEDE